MVFAKLLAKNAYTLDELMLGSTVYFRKKPICSILLIKASNSAKPTSYATNRTRFLKKDDLGIYNKALIDVP
jgi:hypothetical protein